MSGRVRGPGRVRATERSVSSWWWPADLGALGAMVVLGSTLLVAAYGSLAPVWAAAAGAAVAIAVLFVLRRLGLPGWLAVPGIAVGVVLIGSLVVAPELREFGVLPSAAGMTTVLRGLLGGWRELLTVATPTGVSGALLVPPLLIGAVATGLAGWVAAGRRPETALAVPAGASLVFALFGDTVAGRGAVLLVGCGGLVAAVSWVVWVGSRVRRRQVARFSGAGGVRRPPTDLSPESRSRRGFAARRMAVATAALSVACSLGAVAALSATPSRVALREVTQTATDPSGFVSPLSTFRAYTGDRADDIQMTATGLAPGARLRLAGLDAYDGRQFSVSDAAGPFVRIGQSRPATTAAAESATVSVVLQNYSGQFLPVPGPITELTFTGPRAAAVGADLRYSDAAATGLLPDGWRSGDSYTVVAQLPITPTAQQLAAAAVSPVTFPSAVVLPDALRSAVNRYIAGVSGAGAQVEAIRAGLVADGYFSHGGTDEELSAAGHGLDRMTKMVTAPAMVGDQEQYAALMALMVRSLGIPARVGVGFVVPQPDAADAAAAGTDSTAGSGSALGSGAGGSDNGGSGGVAPAGADPAARPSAATAAATIRGRDISAWVEVPFDGMGWVAFDPTPTADKPQTDTQERSQTERRAVAVESPPALQPEQPESLDTDSAGQRTDGPDGNDSGADSGSGWPLQLLAATSWLALVVALAATPIVLILAVKNARRRRRSAGTPREQITGGWEQLVAVAVDAGYRPTFWHTRTETAADLQAGGLLQVDWLAPAADAAEFAPGADAFAIGAAAVTEENAKAYWREVDDRSAELLAGLPLWRRWRARVSLASMRRLDRRRR